MRKPELDRHAAEASESRQLGRAAATLRFIGWRHPLGALLPEQAPLLRVTKDEFDVRRGLGHHEI
jgi:hypothetical protein